jgi:nicotinamide-nucleotide amidase
MEDTPAMSERLDALAAELGRRLSAGSLKLVTAESCTGGWIAKVVTDIPGSSGWLDRGFVTYSNESKRELLGVAVETLATAGAVSAETVAEMAQGALANSRADLAVAVSGIAGPGGGSEEKPVGTVFFAWMRRGEEPHTQRVQFAGERHEVRHQSVRLALERLLELLPAR